LSLKQKAIVGASWVAAANVGRLALQMLATILLARILSPVEFGLMGMLIVFINFAALFSELGFSAALVQREHIEERHSSSVFWVNLAAGVTLTLIMALLAPLIAAFYRVPMLAPITAAVALNFSIGAFNDVQTALLQRAMDFRRLAMIRIGSVATAGAVAVGMALAGFGVWSLVAQMLVQTSTEVLIMWWTTPWKPKLLFDAGAVRELLGFSANFTGFKAFNYWVRNADNLLIGRFVGEFDLGLYTQAYNLLLLPSRITNALSDVMFPTFSRIQDETDRIKRILLKTQRAIGLITIPMMAGLLVVADPFVSTLFGEAWTGMVPLLQLMCLVAIKQPVGSTMGWVFQSQGRTDLQFRWAIVAGLITVLLFAIGVQWGVLGVAVAYVLHSYLLWYHGITIPGRLIGLSFREFLTNLGPVIGVSLAMLTAVVLVGQLLPVQWPAPAALSVQVLVGGVVYLGLLHALDIKAYRELLALLQEQRTLRAGPP